MLNLFKKVFSYALVVILGFILFPIFIILIFIRLIIKRKFTKQYKQRCKNGFFTSQAVEVGGIKQWLSIQGEKKSNPILLMLPGGPGASMMPYSRVFDPLLSNFNVVQWDQRGIGKTLKTNKAIGLPQTDLAEIYQDTLQTVNYLRNHFHQEKIYLFGHSFGSVLGLSLAHDYPNLLHGYIGAGQVINTRVNEQKGFEDTLQLAIRKNNNKAIDALQKLTSFKDKQNTISIDELFILRKFQFKLNGLDIKFKKLMGIILPALCEPSYSLPDYLYMIKSMVSATSAKHIIEDVMKINFEDKTNFSIPIIFLVGNSDYVTHANFVQDFHHKVNAPYKQCINLQNAGHNAYLIHTKELSQALSALVKLTAKQRDKIMP